MSDFLVWHTSEMKSHYILKIELVITSVFWGSLNSVDLDGDIYLFLQNRELMVTMESKETTLLCSSINSTIIVTGIRRLAMFCERILLGL